MMPRKSSVSKSCLAAMQQFQNTEGTPGPESTNAAPMTAAQRDAIYGGSSNAPQHTSNVSEAQAEAKQRALARERQKQDAINSDTMAIDFAHAGETANRHHHQIRRRPPCLRNARKRPLP